MSVDAEIAAAVRDAMETHLRPYLRRLADPECLTYTPPQAGAVIGCSSRKIEQLIADGVLPRLPHTAHILLPRVAVEAFALGGDPAGAVRAALDVSIENHKLRAAS